MLNRFALAFDHLVSRLSWHALGGRRRIALAVLVAAMAFGVLTVLQPPAPKTVRAWVAAADLAVGATISGSDIRAVDVPPALLPDSAITHRGDLVGQNTAAPVPKGLFITAPALANSQFYDQAPPGTVATPVRFSDSQLVGLLQPGDRINVMVTRPNSFDTANSRDAEIVARRALVLAVPQTDQNTGGLLGSNGATGGNIVILAVPEAVALTLIAASELGTLSVVLVQ